MKGRNKIRRRKKSPDEILKIIVSVIFGILILFIALSSFNITSLSGIKDGAKNFFYGFRRGSGYPYRINSSTVKSMGVLNGDLVILKDDCTVSLNGTAKEIKNEKHTYATPVMDIKGNRILLYDRGGTRYRTETRTGIVHEGRLEDDEKIITAAMGKSDNMAFGTLSDSSMSRLTVISSNNKKKEFVWNCADSVIDAVALSDNGKRVAAATIGSKDGKPYSKVTVFDIKGGKPAVLELPGATVLDMNFMSGDTLAIVCDEKFVVFRNLKESETVEYGSSSLVDFDFANNGTAILVLSEYGSMNSQKMVCYGKNGKVTGEVRYSVPVKSLYVSGNRIAVLTRDSAITYNTKGKEIRKYRADNKAIAAYPVGSRTYIYEMGNIIKAQKKD